MNPENSSNLAFMTKVLQKLTEDCEDARKEYEQQKALLEMQQNLYNAAKAHMDGVVFHHGVVDYVVTKMKNGGL